MKKNIALTVLFSLPFFLQAFSPSTEQTERDLKILGVYFLQAINLPIFGLAALVCSVLGMILVNRKLKITGLVFLSLFTLVTLFGLWVITKEALENTIWNTLFWIELVVIIICVVLLSVKRTAKKISRTTTNLHSEPHSSVPEEEEDEFPYFKK